MFKALAEENSLLRLGCQGEVVGAEMPDWAAPQGEVVRVSLRDKDGDVLSEGEGAVGATEWDWGRASWWPSDALH